MEAHEQVNVVGDASHCERDTLSAAAYAREETVHTPSARRVEAGQPARRAPHEMNIQPNMNRSHVRFIGAQSRAVASPATRGAGDP